MGSIEQSIEAGAVRIALVSLTMMPMLVKEIFEEQMDAAFLDRLAELNGRLFAADLQPPNDGQETK
jgi:hypothetical protein